MLSADKVRQLEVIELWANIISHHARLMTRLNKVDDRRRGEMVENTRAIAHELETL